MLSFVVTSVVWLTVRKRNTSYSCSLTVNLTSRDLEAAAICAVTVKLAVELDAARLMLLGVCHRRGATDEPERMVEPEGDPFGGPVHLYPCCWSHCRANSVGVSSPWAEWGRVGVIVAAASLR